MGYLYLEALKSVRLVPAYFPDFVEHVNMLSDPRVAVSKLLLNSSANQFSFGILTVHRMSCAAQGQVVNLL